MTYSSFKITPKCSIPRRVEYVQHSELPSIVSENIEDLNNCNVYLTIAEHDGSYLYTAFNTKKHTASRVTLFDVQH